MTRLLGRLARTGLRRGFLESVPEPKTLPAPSEPVLDPGAQNDTAVALGGDLDEVGQLMSSINQVFLVKNTLSESPKETRHTVLEYLSTRTKQRRIRIQIMP